MSKIIQIQDINSSDTLKTMVEKINYNFDQIMAFGGGPKGEMGLRGFIGPDGEQGEQGERGNLITVVNDISTVGDNLKAGDLAIYSDNEYIYKVEEIDGEKHFVSTNICIKGDAGESGTSTSPFKYSGDAIITNPNGTDVPKYTFIGTNKNISGNRGNLNVVGNNGIYIFTPTDDTVSDNGYCGKIYGGKLGSKNILVLSGEDGDDNYVKIDKGNTLLTDKIHSSDNGIKIAEIINDGVVLGDESKNASIECNKFTVTSPNINLKGNLFVNNNDYNYTTKICGNSININSSNVIIGKDPQSNTQINGNVIVSGKITASSSRSHNLAFYNQLNIADLKGFGNALYVNYIGSTKPINEYVFCQGRGISASSQYSNITCASVHANGNVTIDAQYSDTYGLNVNTNSNLCPIGTIVIWAARSIPDGWKECNGQEISNEWGGYNILRNLFGTKLPDLRGRFVVGAKSSSDTLNLANDLEWVKCGNQIYYRDKDADREKYIAFRPYNSSQFGDIHEGSYKYNTPICNGTIYLKDDNNINKLNNFSEVIMVKKSLMHINTLTIQCESIGNFKRNDDFYLYTTSPTTNSSLENVCDRFFTITKINEDNNEIIFNVANATIAAIIESRLTSALINHDRIGIQGTQHFLDYELNETEDRVKDFGLIGIHHPLSTGGASLHTLAPEESGGLPDDTRNVSTSGSDTAKMYVSSYRFDASKYHNNLPPYYALYYIIRVE